MKRFEATILGSSDESIFVASKLLDQISRDLSFLSNTLTTFKSFDANLLPPATTPEEKKDNATVPTTDAEKKLVVEQTEAEKRGKFIRMVLGEVRDFRANGSNFDDLDRTLEIRLSSAIQELLMAEEGNQPIHLYEDVDKAYKEALSFLNSKNGGTNFTSFIELLGDKQKKEATSQGMEIIAQNILNKWVGKAVHKLNPFDKTSPLRLDVSKVSERIRKGLDQILDILEKSDFDPATIDPLMKEVKSDFGIMKNLMRPLKDTIENKMFDRKFLEMIEDNKLPDFGSNLDKKQRERLQRTLEQRKFRDLGRFYDDGEKR